MKNVKKLGYLIILLSFVLVGCGQRDKKDAERLGLLHDKVESLFNDEMTDLAANNSAIEFEETALDIEREKDHTLNEENESFFLETEELYQEAVEMDKLEKEIDGLYSGEAVKEGVDDQEIENLSLRLVDIDSSKWTDYVPRQEERLAEANDQLEKVKLAADLVADLYADYSVVKSNLTREEEKQARKAVEEVKNEKIRENLEKRLEKVDQKLIKLEEEKEKKAAEGMGFFEGMFLSSDNFILYLDENLLLVAQNDASDHMAYYEITDILSNTGKELTLALYEKEDEFTGVEGGEEEQTFYISDDYETITTKEGDEFHRLTQEEIDEVYERLNGIKEIIDSKTTE